jgi:hypothetical protein
MAANQQVMDDLSDLAKEHDLEVHKETDESSAYACDGDEMLYIRFSGVYLPEGKPLYNVWFKGMHVNQSATLLEKDQTTKFISLLME